MRKNRAFVGFVGFVLSLSLIVNNVAAGQFNISAQTIVANVQKNSAGVTLPANVGSVLIQLTDPNGVWSTTTGNIIVWGVMRSTDNGATWTWFQGATNVPFGTPLARVSIQLSAFDANGNPIAAAKSGDLLRLSILTDTDIVLGATITAQ